jgi:hypothetical protein
VKPILTVRSAIRNQKRRRREDSLKKEQNNLYLILVEDFLNI